MELLAIGIGHDVTRYYRRAVTVTDAEELAGVMTEKLAELFDEDLARRQLHRTVPSRGAAEAPEAALACSSAAHGVIRRASRVAVAAMLQCGPGAGRQAADGADRADRDHGHRHPHRFRSRQPRAASNSASSSSGAGSISSPSPPISAATRRWRSTRRGHSLLAISDAGTWLRATLDYDGRKLKGLSDVVARARCSAPTASRCATTSCAIPRA